jgi:hypothetical protein
MEKYCTNIEYLIFAFLLFAQNFALFTVKNSGVSALTVFLIVMFIIYKLYKYNIKILIKLCSIFLLICLVGLVVNKYYNIMKIIRWFMIFFIGFTLYNYLRSKKEFEINKIYNSIHKLGFLIGIYGIYQFIAPYFKLPLFLNIFQNNPSYRIDTGAYNYFGGGWVKQLRVYTLFSEPSFYAIFLVILIIILLGSNIKNKRIYLVMYLVNLYLTYSRSGWMVLIIVSIFYIILELSNKYEKNFIKKIIKFIVLILPLISILGIDLFNKIVFHDLSSSARTNSAIYYLLHSFDTLKTTLFGHGIGYIQTHYNSVLFKTQFVEAFAHNGYVEIIYEFGWLVFILILFLLVKVTKTIKNNEYSMLFLILVCSINIFESYYYIESIVALLTILYFVCKNAEMNFRLEMKKLFKING